jgi:hypothetical protein
MEIFEQEPALVADLDEAVSRLREVDRAAIVLRYFQGLEFAEVGATLRISEDAARQRVTRAVGKLRSKMGAPVTDENLAKATAFGAPASVATLKAVVTRTVLRTSARGAAASVSAAPSGARQLGAMLKLKIAAVLVGVFSLTAIGIGTAEWVQSDSPATPDAPSMAPSLPAVPTSTAALLTKDDIRAAIEAGRSEISDLEVSYSFNVVNLPAGFPDEIAQSQIHLIFKDGKIFLGEDYGLAGQQKLFHRQTSYDGFRTTFFMPALGSATVEPGRKNEVRIQGIGFFDMMLFNPPSGGDGFKDQSLVSALLSPLSKLRSQREIIDGHSCYILDVLSDPEWKNIVLTVWLDPDRGFLPIRQRFGHVSDGIPPHLEVFIDDAIKVDRRLWLPVRGRKKVYVEAKGTGKEVLIERSMQVRKDANGKFDLHINSNVNDAVFDIPRHPPPGTRLFDTAARLSWTAR